LLSKNGENDIDVVLDAMAGTNLRVQDIAKVRQGIISGADKVTRGHVEKLGAESGLVGKGIFVLSADEVASLNLSQSEQAYVKPHFKNSDIFRYGAKNEATEFIIFADRRTMELENLPVLSDHLGQFSSFLQGGDSTFPYLHRPRAISYEAEKIIVSKRAPDNRFGYSDGIWYGSSDINFIESSNPLISTKALLGLLNSSFYYAWFYHRGKRKGKLLELFQVPIAEAPAPVLNPENIKRLAILEGLVSEVIALSKDGPSKATEMLEVRIDELVGTLFGFTEEQTDLVSSWARLEKESLGDIEYDTIDDE
jgi:adenine-specific DNA-methyltransferase